METLQNVVLGPFYDLKRLVTGAVVGPPPSRMLSEEKVAAARTVLTAAGCDLAGCRVQNLHTWPTTLSPDQLYDLVGAWHLWPRSAFFACPKVTDFAYRLYKVIPVVKMKLKTAVKPRHIIYDIEWGIGRGGYHSFLVGPSNPATGDRTTFSIFTIIPPTWLFREGLHDQTNHDIYRKLATFEVGDNG